MDKDIITIFDNNNQTKDYKLLLVIDNEYKYIIYTDIYNLYIKNNIYSIKIKELISNEEILPINDNEWQMIEDNYLKLINI